MPIAEMTQMILAAGSDKYIEPITKNRYRLYLMTLQVIQALGARENSGYLQTVLGSMVDNEVPLEVSFTPPSVTVEPRTIRGEGNVQVKYGGWTTYGNAETRFHNWVALDTFKFFYAWAAMSGGLYLLPQDEIINSRLPSKSLAVPDGIDGPGTYKCNAIASAYGTPDTVRGTEYEFSRWLMKGVFPATVSIDGFDHTDDGEQVLTTVSFSCDLCLPVYVTEVRRAYQEVRRAELVTPVRRAALNVT